MNIEVGDRVTFFDDKNGCVTTIIIVTDLDLAKYNGLFYDKIYTLIKIERPKYEVIKWNY